MLCEMKKRLFWKALNSLEFQHATSLPFVVWKHKIITKSWIITFLLPPHIHIFSMMILMTRLLYHSFAVSFTFYKMIRWMVVRCAREWGLEIFYQLICFDSSNLSNKFKNYSFSSNDFGKKAPKNHLKPLK